MVRKAAPQPGKTAYARALGRLARRDHSEAELRTALRDRGHSPEDVKAALERLRAQRFLDDTGFAERFARSRLLSHRVGRHRIQQGLRQRGVDRKVAEDGLRKALVDAPEHQALEAAARSYWRTHGRDEPAKRIRKLWAFLLRRGFPADLVGERLGALWPRHRSDLEGLAPLEGESLE
ncbi:MAG TPA: regulatory protein RecX [Vicinamibacteria bacterium]